VRGDVSREAAVFLDRDGVIVEDPGHLHRPEDLRVLPGAVESIRELRRAGFKVIVVTNQSAVARGLLTEQDLAALHASMAEQLARGGAMLHDILYCPHHPEGLGAYAIACECRKPAPGMLLAAQARHGLDLARSFLVGDQLSDVAAAHRAGCRPILVRPPGGGNLRSAAGPLEVPETICADLREAARYILSRGANEGLAAGAGRDE